jgi:hypothetical protein
LAALFCLFLLSAGPDATAQEAAAAQGAAAQEASAQEAVPNRFSAGLGLALNIYSPDRFGLGATLSGEYRLPLGFAAGPRFGLSYSPDKLLTLEPGAFFRWYPASIPVFLEAGTGATLLFTDQMFRALAMGSGGLGLRLPLGPWYIEVLIRGGYPFIVEEVLSLGYAGRSRRDEPVDLPPSIKR